MRFLQASAALLLVGQQLAWVQATTTAANCAPVPWSPYQECPATSTVSYGNIAAVDSSVTTISGTYQLSLAQESSSGAVASTATCSLSGIKFNYPGHCEADSTQVTFTMTGADQQHLALSRSAVQTVSQSQPLTGALCGGKNGVDGKPNSNVQLDDLLLTIGTVSCNQPSTQVCVRSAYTIPPTANNPSYQGEGQGEYGQWSCTTACYVPDSNTTPAPSTTAPTTAAPTTTGAPTTTAIPTTTAPPCSTTSTVNIAFLNSATGQPEATDDDAANNGGNEIVSLTNPSGSPVYLQNVTVRFPQSNGDATNTNVNAPPGFTCQPAGQLTIVCSCVDTTSCQLANTQAQQDFNVSFNLPGSPPPSEGQTLTANYTVTVAFSSSPSCPSQQVSATQPVSPPVYCFAAHSAVAMANGSSKRFDQLIRGDAVLTANGATAIIDAVSAKPYQGYLYSINGNRAVFEVTGEHLLQLIDGQHVYLDQTAWDHMSTLGAAFPATRQLQVGDVLKRVTTNGKVAGEMVHTIERRQTTQKTYVFNAQLANSTDRHYLVDGYAAHHMVRETGQIVLDFIDSPVPATAWGRAQKVLHAGKQLVQAAKLTDRSEAVTAPAGYMERLRVGIWNSHVHRLQQHLSGMSLHDSWLASEQLEQVSDQVGLKWQHQAQARLQQYDGSIQPRARNLLSAVRIVWDIVSYIATGTLTELQVTTARWTTLPQFGKFDRTYTYMMHLSPVLVRAGDILCRLPEQEAELLFEELLSEVRAGVDQWMAQGMVTGAVPLVNAAHINETATWKAAGARMPIVTAGSVVHSDL